MIQYSTIVPYYVKVDHNLTFVSSMTLPKHVASQRRTENKGISILLLVETNLAFSKSIQNHDADFLHRLLRKKDRKLAHTCNSSFCNKGDVLSLSNSRIGDELHRIYPHQLELKDTTETQKSASDPDIYLKIDNGGRLKTNLYDKHDDFTFPISQ